MALFSPTAGASGREDYAALLASPAGFLASPALGAGLFASPAPAKGAAVKEGRLSFDVLQLEADESAESSQEGVLEAMGAPSQIKAARSASHSHLELFALAPGEHPKSADGGAAPAPAAAPGPPSAQLQKEQLAELKERVVAKALAAKQLEVAELVAGVAAKYGLPADYARAEQTIKAVWAKPSCASGASSAADAVAPTKQQPQQQTGGAVSLTLAGRVSSDNVSCEEEGGQHATSTLKPAARPAATEGAATGNALKRPLAPAAPSFTFNASAQPGSAPAAPASDDAALKKRRVQYDRMRDLEVEVQRQRHLGNVLKQSLLQEETKHTDVMLENEQLWNALTHIHVSLRAAHAAHLRQQVAMHTAALAAALPLQAMDAAAPSPNTLFGGLFSPDAEELAAACGMFVSPAKNAQGTAPANKPRKLFLEEEAKAGSAGRPALPAELSPAMWVQAA